MTVTNHQSQACFNAWINCEDLLVSICHTGTSMSKKFSRVIDECALICMGTFHAMKSHSQNLGRLALLCVGICEECAELCESREEDLFQRCALVCKECSTTLGPLAYSDLNDHSVAENEYDF